jgi:hypothetical protein
MRRDPDLPVFLDADARDLARQTCLARKQKRARWVCRFACKTPKIGYHSGFRFSRRVQGVDAKWC